MGTRLPTERTSVPCAGHPADQPSRSPREASATTGGSLGSWIGARSRRSKLLAGVGAGVLVLAIVIVATSSGGGGGSAQKFKTAPSVRLSESVVVYSDTDSEVCITGFWTDPRNGKTVVTNGVTSSKPGRATVTNNYSVNIDPNHHAEIAAEPGPCNAENHRGGISCSIQGPSTWSSRGDDTSAKFGPATCNLLAPAPAAGAPIESIKDVPAN
jgi:hypothetical protein